MSLMNITYLYSLRINKHTALPLLCSILLFAYQNSRAQNRLPELRYNGLQYECEDSISTGPAMPERYRAYATLLAKREQLRNIVAAEGFKDVIITSKEVSTANHPLLARLEQLGIIPRGATPTNIQLTEYIKQGQRLFDLEEDAVIGQATLSALNTPLSVRIGELELALNTLDWLSCAINDQTVIVVNIPSASLQLFEGRQVALHSNIICGKPNTPTSTLCATVKEVILYPYWNVPYNIATREMLPRIKKSRSYLDANNLQVVNSGGKVINPANINWRALSRSHFPYRLRQSTGCDNSLGIVKLNFSNPFTIYMHDTPAKSLFGSRKRFFSHGCMRVEKAMELARHIVTDAQPIDDIEEKGCIEYQSPVIIPVQKKASVFVLYNTAWTDSAGEVHFYGDVYNKLLDIP